MVTPEELFTLFFQGMRGSWEGGKPLPEVFPCHFVVLT